MPSGSEIVDALAEVLWMWSWTVDQQRHHRPYPYERLIEATKEDLRAIAAMLLRGAGNQEKALLEIAAVQADCEQAKWMRDRAQGVLGIGVGPYASHHS